MTKTHSTHKPRAFLFLGTSLLLGLSTGCGLRIQPEIPSLQARAVVSPATISSETAPAYQASEEPYAAPPAAAPTEQASSGQYAQSGGTSIASAEPISLGAILVGRVARGAPRYYALDLAVGDSVELTAYFRDLADGSDSIAALLEPDEVRLADVREICSPKSDWERGKTQAIAKQRGRHILRVSSSGQVEFKVLIGGATPLAQ